MKTATVRDAQHHLSKLLAEVEDGEEIILTRRGKKLAKLSLYEDLEEDEVSFPDFGALRKEMGTDVIKGPNAILQMREDSP